MPHVENDWESLCIELNFDRTGDALDAIRAMWGENTKACCREVLKRWMKGEGEDPHTWAKMIDCLTAIGALEAVGAIREHLFAGSCACKSVLMLCKNVMVCLYTRPFLIVQHLYNDFHISH